MATTNSLDVAHEIKVDHNNVRDLFQRYTAASDPAEKTAIANTLIREMAIHGDAEELSVYNEYSALSLGSTVVHNKEEHAEIKRLVYDADAARVDSPGYDGVLQKAVTAFLTHAKEEEDQQLPIIVSKLTPEENDKLARAFLKARTSVPTRPHPWAPQTGGLAQKAVGLQGALHDKVVETLEGRKFVDLQYQHPAEF